MQPIAGVEHEDMSARAELAADRAGCRLDHLLDRQHARKITRDLEQRARAALAMGRDARLVAQPRCQLADDQADGEHHGEGEDVLDVGDA